MFAHSNIYPILDICKFYVQTTLVCSRSPWLHLDPAVYPYLNIYPTGLRIESPSSLSVVSNFQNERVEVRLPSLYPNFDICESKYY